MQVNPLFVLRMPAMALPIALLAVCAGPHRLPGTQPGPWETFVEIQLVDSAGAPLLPGGDDSLRIVCLSADSFPMAPTYRPQRRNTLRLMATMNRKPLMLGFERRNKAGQLQRMGLSVPGYPGGHHVAKITFRADGAYLFGRYDFWDTGYGTRANLIDWIQRDLSKRWQAFPSPDPVRLILLDAPAQECLEDYLAGSNVRAQHQRARAAAGRFGR